MIDLEMNLNVIKDNEGGKSVTIFARQSGVSYSIVPRITKNKSKVMEAVKG